jgi:hypothetical protein
VKLRSRLLWLGRAAGAVAILGGLGSLIPQLIATDSDRTGNDSPIAAALVLAAALVIFVASRWPLVGIAVAAAGSLGLVLKPAIWPMHSEWANVTHQLSYTAETHLYFVVPGVLLLGLCAVAGALRVVPPSWWGVDGESSGKDLLSTAGIGFGALGAGVVLVAVFLVDRASLEGLVLRFIPGLLLGLIGLVALVLGVVGALASEEQKPAALSPSLAADMSDMGSLLRAVAAAPDRDVAAWLPTEGVDESRARAAPGPLRQLVGQHVDRFEVLAPLGAGGMGRVFRARDTRLLREVALKLLPPELMHDPVRRERLLREARAAARVSHPNVCAIHEVSDTGTVPYIVMELVQGRTLRDRLEAGPLELGEALALAREIALGLAAAHAQGIVHRDLKPENVALTPDSRVKLLDFGLARFDQAPDAFSSTAVGSPLLTRDGQVLGTPAYMSPEQALGRSVDARSDVFSFGTLLFELITGRSPFMRVTSEDTRRAVIEAELPSDGWDAALPVALVAIVHRATEREPAVRYADGAELVAAIDAAKRAIPLASALAAS